MDAHVGQVAAGPGRSLLHATLAMRDVVEAARAALPAEARDVQLYAMTQGPVIAMRGTCRAAAIPEDRCVMTYARLGHLGGADPLIGLESAAKAGCLPTGTTLLLATTNATSTVTPLLVDRVDSIAVPKG